MKFVTNKHCYYFEVHDDVDLSPLIDCVIHDSEEAMREFCFNHGTLEDNTDEFYLAIEIKTDCHSWLNGGWYSYEDSDENPITPQEFINNFII